MSTIRVTNTDTSTESGAEQTRYIAGLIKGMVAVVLFSLTVPMTKLALEGFSPESIAASRAFFAGLGAWWVIAIAGWRRPSTSEFLWLGLAGIGVVLGFPYVLNLSLTGLSAANMGVALAGLPLITAMMAALINGDRYSKGFWFFALCGAGILLLFFRSGLAEGVTWTVLATMLLGGLGYAGGARAAKTLGGWPTICWMLVIYLPISSIAFGYSLGHQGIPQGWLPVCALLYLALISQWCGFYFWYQGMAEAGTGTVSQLQLLQPFFTLMFAALLLAEQLDMQQLYFAGLIVVTLLGALKFK